MTETLKKDYIQLVCDATNKEYDEVKAIMGKAKSDLGVTYGEYFNNKLYELTPTQQAVEARRIIIRRNNRQQRLAKISAATGLTNSEIRQKISEINEKNIVRMTIILYAKYEVFRFEGEKLDAFLGLFVQRDQLKSKLLDNFIKIDNGELSYADITPLLNEFYSVVEKMMPESLFTELADTIQVSCPDLVSDAETCRRTAIDMEATRVLLPFSLSEYVAFHFARKNIEEKRKFISDKERMEILNEINDPSKFDFLDDKYQAYELLSKYYHRNLLYVTSADDFKAFRKFCKNNERIVIKDPCETMGRGIEAIDVPKRRDIKELFSSLLAKHDTFLVEELIIAHDCIKALNPDSVNTIRMITYYNGENSIVHDCFMKVGQKGSFIDNGGAGGILIHVDPKTGMLDSPGCDENGVVYETHPYTEVKFNGYQLPDWDKAIALGLELSTKIPGLNYIGWDFTYTSDNQWIVVEGNAKTQFYGQQCPSDIGVRDDFLKTIGYKK